MKKVGIVSLGCAKNLVDSEIILASFVNAKYQVTNNSSLNLFLFAQNEGGTPHWDCSMFLYRCSIWVNDTPIREFIPCYRKSDGLNGLYDVIERKYYPCQGVSYFNGGQEVL